jgi:hypothetical protein
MRPTWTLLPDTTAENPSRDLEAEQEEYLIAHIGLTLYGALCVHIKEEYATRPGRSRGMEENHGNR